ncbi:uncharacterized protein [Palaemon carinicauda]|uniref:uncharacterized protein n=1 Tax=Palaemon carinicauda TaxID=392227 RepID=UPI0035B658F9
MIFITTNKPRNMKSILLLICLLSPSIAEGTESECQEEADFPIRITRTNDGSFSAVIKLKSKSLSWRLDLDIVSTHMHSTQSLAMVTLDAESRYLNLNCSDSVKNEGQQVYMDMNLTSITLKFQINGTLLKVFYQKSSAAFVRIGKLPCDGFGSKERFSLVRRGEGISGLEVTTGTLCSSGNERNWISPGTVAVVTVLILATVCLVIVTIRETIRLCKEKTAEPKENVTRNIFDRLPPISSRQMLTPPLGQHPGYRIQEEREVTFITDSSKRTESTGSAPENNVQVLYKVRTTVNVPEGVCNSLSSRGQGPSSGSSVGYVHQDIPSTRYLELTPIYDNLENFTSR